MISHMRIFAAAIFFATIFSIGAVSFVSAESSQTFFVAPAHEKDGKTQETARFLLSSAKTNMYVEDAYFQALLSDQQKSFTETAQKLADEFDQTTYPRLRALFGSEWESGIDNDSRVTIYFTEMKKESDGYTRKNDEYSKSALKDSNEREMLYVNAARLMSPSQANTILAHEFQHLIDFYQKTKLRGVQEEEWLNEAKSEYAVTAAGFNAVWEGSRLQESVRLVRANPNDALLLWEDNPVDYASVSLFMHYLAGRYGSEFITQLSASQYVGTEAITQALKSIGSTRTFSDVFEDWTIALLLNRDIDGSGRYAYGQSFLQYDNVHIQPPVTHTISGQTPSIQSSAAFQDFQPQWYRFVPSLAENKKLGALEISFQTYGKSDYVRMPVLVTLLTGEVRVFRAETRDGKASITIPNFAEGVSSVVVIPASHTEMFVGGGSGMYRIFSLSVRLLEDSPARARVSIRDGDLIRAKGTNEVYVVLGLYRRWIQSSKIMAMYSHLKWENVVEVSAEELQRYSESFFVQKSENFRVYEVTRNGVKKWLNMASNTFEAGGRAWDGIFTVNEREFAWYKTGADIRK